jgi:hypothetical protein
MDEDERVQRDFEIFIRLLEEKEGIRTDRLRKALDQHDAMDRRAEQIVATVIRILVTAILTLIGWGIYQGIVHFIEAIEHVR